MVYGYIYKTTDIKTGKVYIGQHKKSIFDTKYKGSGNIIKKIIKKRSQDLITELLEWCDTLDELNLAEIKYIAEYKSQDRRCVSECSRAGFTRESVCKCWRNEMKKHKGYRWSYKKILITIHKNI